MYFSDLLLRDHKRQPVVMLINEGDAVEVLGYADTRRGARKILGLHPPYRPLDAVEYLIEIQDPRGIYKSGRKQCSLIKVWVEGLSTQPKVLTR